MVENGLSDEAVAGRVLDGDKEAYGYFVDKYSDHVFNIAFRYIRDRGEALEVSQDVFVKAYKSLGEVKDYSLMERWLARIAVNTALNRLRGKKRTPSVSDKIAEYTEGKSAGDSGVRDFNESDRDAVWKAISQLPENLRIVVIMKYMDGFSYVEIAKRLNISKATVRTRLARAKRMMKSALVPDSGAASAQQIA